MSVFWRLALSRRRSRRQRPCNRWASPVLVISLIGTWIPIECTFRPARVLMPATAAPLRRNRAGTAEGRRGRRSTPGRRRSRRPAGRRRRRCPSRSGGSPVGERAVVGNRVGAYVARRTGQVLGEQTGTVPVDAGNGVELLAVPGAVGEVLDLACVVQKTGQMGFSGVGEDGVETGGELACPPCNVGKNSSPTTPLLRPRPSTRSPLEAVSSPDSVPTAFTSTSASIFAEPRRPAPVPARLLPPQGGACSRQHQPGWRPQRAQHRHPGPDQGADQERAT